MRKLFVLLAVFLAVSTVLVAQQESQDVTEPKAEIFAGYAYVHSNLQNFDPLTTEGLNGETLQGTFFLRPRLGVTADITRAQGSNLAQSGVGVTRYTYLFGPTYALQTDSSVTPFAHVLFGEDHERASISNAADLYSNSFAEDIGIGFDVSMTDHLSIRPAQIDLFHTNHSGGESNFRYSAGVDLRF